MSDEVIQVLLVDDHAVVRDGYRRLIEQSEHLKVVAEAENGEAGYQLFQRHQPDVVVLDMSLPDMGGLEVIRRITARDSNARILVVSMHDNPILVEKAVNGGAGGYITKTSGAATMLEAIEAVAAGRTFLDPHIMERMAMRQLRAGSDNGLDELSPREFEVFRLLADGLTTAEIGKRLSLSGKTISNYVSQIKAKLNVSTSAEMARLAIRHGVIQP